MIKSNEMPPEVLVSPLGRSPGAVSGVYFALRAQRDIEITQVITVSTSHSDVKRAAKRYLSPLFEHLGIPYKAIHVPARDLRGGSQEINPYVAMLGLALKQAQSQAGHVHVAVTGGRSGMGALAALATNLYGADQLWHLWVHPDIEKRGTIEQLRGLTDPKAMVETPALNPTKKPDGCEIVNLPFLDLRPLHPLLWHYHKTGQFPDPASPLTQLLTSAKIQRFTEIFPAGLTFAKADELMALKVQYAEADPEERRHISIQLGQILEETGIVSGNKRERLIDLVQGGLSPEALVELAQDTDDSLGFWKWLSENKNSIGVVFDAGVFLFKALTLYRTVKGYG